MNRPLARRTVFTLSVCLSVLLAGVAASQAPHPAPARSLQEAIGRARAAVQANFAPKVPGLSVAAAIDGKVVWSEGFGFADVEAKKAVTPQTMFRIGSISKSVTAAALMKLVEQGKLDLDADIHVYVPDYPDKGAKITTRQLAGHLAGIRHYQGDEFAMNKPFATVRDGLRIFENDPLLAPPGEKYSYSTYGWSVISAVMEGAAKEDFLKIMQREVFDALKMKSTVADRAGASVPERTRFYEVRQNGAFEVSAAVDNSYKWAGGGLLSTPEDLVRFGNAHLRPGFLKQASLDVLFTSQKTSDGKETGYGIGWGVSQDSGGHAIWSHTGGSMGGTSALVIHPQSRVVVAMTSNCSRSPFDKNNREALAEIFAAFAAVK